MKFDILVLFPRLEMTGKYKFALKILSAPVKGEGDFYTLIENFRGKIRLQGSIYRRNGLEYINFAPVQIKIAPGVVKDLKLGNFLNGVPILPETVETVLRSNNDFLLNEMIPHLENSMSQLFTSIANRIAHDAPLNEFFPIK